ncbi:unnamed protein product [Nippostrongylus brasiliensis]|uniref:BZIP domain-containing protein n=1 Tax=Nippostrongylus brasiliensis TaxID=27835 RepID=A0A0N4Y0X6_NIPBR|nr:unnamed protein product [Nippostrongylus brasiliensis]
MAFSLTLTPVDTTPFRAPRPTVDSHYFPQFSEFYPNSAYSLPHAPSEPSLPFVDYTIPQPSFYLNTPFATPPISPQQHYAVRPEEEIFNEIVQECQEIELRSASYTESVSSPSLTSFSDPESPASGYHEFQEKRERKKAQNRVAAVRYREKKKMEKQAKSSTIAVLSLKNQELKKKVADVSGEIAMMKKLMGEIGILRT